jgi:ribonuclease PH
MGRLRTPAATAAVIAAATEVAAAIAPIGIAIAASAALADGDTHLSLVAQRDVAARIDVAIAVAADRGLDHAVDLVVAYGVRRRGHAEGAVLAGVESR